MILSDSEIKRHIYFNKIKIGNRTDEQILKAIQPNSIDLHLGSNIRIWYKESKFVFDPAQRDHADLYQICNIEEEREDFIIEPGQFILAETAEDITIGNELTACVEGISSVGRFGMFVVNAGRVESGWKGVLTLELLNSAEHHTRLCAGMRIAQLTFSTLLGKVEYPYGIRGRYQGSKGVEASKAWKDYE